MSFEAKLKEMVESGHVSSAQAEDMKKSMGLLGVTPPPVQKRGISLAAITGLAALMLGASGATAFWRSSGTPEVVEAPQNVADAMNAAGAAGAASPGLITFFSTVLFVILPTTIVMLWLASIYNRLAAAETETEEAQGIVEAAQQKRADLLPKLGEVVRAALSHEQKVQGEAADISGAGQLVALMEEHPELKANENLLALQQQLVYVENGLEAARNLYNYEAKKYNVLLKEVMGGFVGALAGFKEKTYFEGVADSTVPEVMKEGE